MSKNKKVFFMKINNIANDAYDNIEQASIFSIQSILYDIKHELGKLWDSQYKSMYLEYYMNKAKELSEKMKKMPSKASAINPFVSMRKGETIINETYDLVEFLSLLVIPEFFETHSIMSKEDWNGKYKEIYLDKFGEQTVAIVEALKKRLRRSSLGL